MMIRVVPLLPLVSEEHSYRRGGKGSASESVDDGTSRIREATSVAGLKFKDIKTRQVGVGAIERAVPKVTGDTVWRRSSKCPQTFIVRPAGRE